MLPMANASRMASLTVRSRQDGPLGGGKDVVGQVEEPEPRHAGHREIGQDEGHVAAGVLEGSDGGQRLLGSVNARTS